MQSRLLLQPFDKRLGNILESQSRHVYHLPVSASLSKLPAALPAEILSSHMLMLSALHTYSYFRQSNMKSLRDERVNCTHLLA